MNESSKSALRKPEMMPDQAVALRSILTAGTVIQQAAGNAAGPGARWPIASLARAAVHGGSSQLECDPSACKQDTSQWVLPGACRKPRPSEITYLHVPPTACTSTLPAPPASNGTRVKWIWFWSPTAWKKQKRIPQWGNGQILPSTGAKSLTQRPAPTKTGGSLRSSAVTLSRARAEAGAQPSTPG